MAQTTEEEDKKVTGESSVYVDLNPCNYLQGFIRAVLKCIGYDQPEPAAADQNSSSTVTSQGSSEQLADPPSSTADPPVNPAAAMARRVRRPPTPPISGGRGPQTNANPS